MITIYVQNKPLFLIDKITETVDGYIHRPDTIFIDDFNPSAVRTMVQQLEHKDYYAGVFLHPDLPELLALFESQLTVIIAAGGLVYTQAHEILLIFRKGKWDLPKGKVDQGEGLEACALREIEEETGAIHLQIGRPLQVTYHTYREKDLHILKESHWFLIEANEKSPLQPQIQEDISACEWVSIERLAGYMGNMHASVVDVMEAGTKILLEKKL
ncbi:MAG TPA: NUDIX domain-containing protein [Flavisolibacter sp.]|jgi:8-oxo-dGTP pyrophosphatase MutT (NUDIX family)|nr:NUDIX domain-containing protein [Flavisolibacter sp.]